MTQSVHNPGIDEIHIQGDVVDDLRTMLIERKKPFDQMPSEADGGLHVRWCSGPPHYVEFQVPAAS